MIPTCKATFHLAPVSYSEARNSLISGRSTVSLFLNFPFEEQTDEFLDTAAHVQAGLSFPLSQKHWKQWRLTKKGTSYLGRRISIQIAADKPSNVR